MKKRIIYYSFQLAVYFILISLSVLLYFVINRPISDSNLINAFEFIVSRKGNFILIYIFLFLISYLAGIFEFSSLNKHSLFKNFLIINFKFVFSVSVVSFIEFFFFFTDKVGRFIYIYMVLIFVIYSYLMILVFKNRRSRTFIVIDKLITNILDKEFSKELDHIDHISLEKFNKTNNKFHLGSYSFLYLNNFPEKSVKFDFLRKKIEGVEFIRLIDLLEIELERIPLDYISADWIIQKFTDLRESYLKLTRFINVLVSLIALIILSPIGFLFSVFNKMFSHGPIFYIQERVGEGGRLFRLFKFRTMRPEAEKDGPVYTTSRDKRITVIGKMMRKLRIDEIPQFINVLNGDMNLIGPRPERAVFAEELTKKLPYYNLRHIVKPGLTGWAQVKYSYAGADLKEQIMKFEYDLFYIKNRNLFLDLLILLKTAKSVFSLKGK